MRLLSFLWLLLPFVAFSQDLNPVSWSFDVEHISGDEYDLIFHADIEKTWNVYSQYIDEGGPFPTTITYETEPLETVGASVESGYKKEGMDPIFEMNVIKFLAKEPYVIRQRIKKGALSTVSGYLTFMTCDDERCLPPTDIDFTIDIANAKSGSNKDRADNSRAKKPVTISSSDAASISWATVPKEDRPVKWSYGLQKIDEQSYSLIFKADIDEGWNVYSQYLDEGGPWPTTIIYEQKDGISLVGDASEEGYKKEGMDPIFEMNVIKFLDKEPYTVTQQITVTDPQAPLSGVLTYMTCDEEKCLPPTDIEFSFDIAQSIALGGLDENIDKTSANAPVAAIANNNTIDQSRENLKATHEAPLANCGEQVTSDKSMLLMFFFGFVGGLLALLTPCVFPMKGY